MYDEMNLPTAIVLLFLFFMIMAIPTTIVYAIMYPSEFDTWAITKDKLCWEQAGNFKISKYGVRCTNMSGGIIFNETFRPKEESK